MSRLAAAALAFASAVGPLAGCATLGYYGQAVRGQVTVLTSREPIEHVIGDPRTPRETARKLEVARAARVFAHQALGLPESGSFTSYVELDRPYPVWSLVAAREFSVEPRAWCYPFAGCLAYRGYFERAAGERAAAGLQAEGYETDLAPVPAYSTLGWFDDPVFSSMLAWDDGTLAEIIFHEHAHELAYADDDTAFSEAFATVVGREGVRRWFAARGDAAGRAAWERRQAVEQALVQLLLAARAELAELYARPLADDARRAAKAARFTRLDDEVRALGERMADPALHPAWAARPVNNARLALVATYEADVPALMALLAEEGGDLPRFYARVRALARLDDEARGAALAPYRPNRP